MTQGRTYAFYRVGNNISKQNSKKRLFLDFFARFAFLLQSDGS